MERSYGESYRLATEVGRDYEAVESAHQTAADKPDDARDEHGDDQGTLRLYTPPPSLTRLSQAGILEEMLDDTLAVEEDEELEEEADAEVDKVLFDLTNGKLGQAGTVESQLPVSTSSNQDNEFQLTYALQAAEDTVSDAETERVMEQYRQQLSGLLS